MSVDQVRPVDLKPFSVSGLSNHLYFPSLFGRSPWSNKYDPPLEDGAMPSARLRKLEVEANNAFDQYRDLYVSSTLQSPLLAFISFSRTHNESKLRWPAASEHGTPVSSRGRRAGSADLLLGSVSAVISRCENMIKFVS